MRPGLTTATQYSGAPLPLPMRVSAGFFVIGLSGNIRIQILPPRLTWRVMAIRAASICRSVIHPGSIVFRPYSPKLIEPPRVAVAAAPARAVAVFAVAPGAAAVAALAARLVDRVGLRAARHGRPRVEDFAAVDPALDADDAVGRVRLGEAVVDVGAQRVQGESPLQVPLAAGDLGAVQTPGDLRLDALGAEAQALFDGLADGAAEGDALLKLRGDLLGLELRVQLRLVHLLNRDQHFSSGARGDVGLELVDLGALATD